MIRLLALLLLMGCADPAAEPGPSSEDSGTETTTGFDLTFGSDEHFDIITWNIETFPKHSRTVEYVINSLLSLQPDAVAIQEVWSADALQEVVEGLPGYQLYLPPDIDDTGLAWLYNGATLNLLKPGYQIFVEDNYDFSYRPPPVLEVEFQGHALVLINLHLKCCGDGIIGDEYWDEERRRVNATLAMREYISQQLGERSVMVMGDWNDSIEEIESSNVFWSLIQDPENFLFADMTIATGEQSNWSYPSYPSHLDHILISNELFEAFEKPATRIETIRIEDALPGGSNEYGIYLSDHRPVGLKLEL